MDRQCTIAVVTGSRAEYGLLRPVMRAIANDDRLSLRVIVAGAHLLPPANTIDEVAEEFDIAATVPMQSVVAENAAFATPRHRRSQCTFSHSQECENVAALEEPPRESMTGRAADAHAVGLGVAGFADHFATDPPDVVLVLGDRIEAFAAAAASAIAGIRVAHLHGGDRAEGIADESLRHAITKLAHIHLPATTVSAQRIMAMGENPDRIHVVGSPGLDGLSQIPPLSDDVFRSLGEPHLVLLMHPIGRNDDAEFRAASSIIQTAREFGPILLLHPNHDPGRNGVMRAIETSGGGCEHRAHLPREAFIGLLKRSGILIGNSSAGLIECAALGVHAINIGTRQRGRERAANVIDVGEGDAAALRDSIKSAFDSPRPTPDHSFGDGQTGPRTAKILATFDPAIHSLAKCNTY
jgi:UDP-hydrolysing UDP-N-acetyl-D-glucosamine 2-epimerase